MKLIINKLNINTDITYTRTPTINPLSLRCLDTYSLQDKSSNVMFGDGSRHSADNITPPFWFCQDQ